MDITGKYRVYQDGELVSEVSNLLTNDGKRELLDIIAGTSPGITRLGLGTMPTGVGGAAVNAADTTLFMPLVDCPVDFSVPLYGSPTSKIVYKARIPETVAGVIYEIGAYNTPEINEPVIFTFGEPQPGGGGLAGPAGGASTNDVRMGATSPTLGTGLTNYTTTEPTSAGVLLSTDNIAFAVKPSVATATSIRLTITDTAGKTAYCDYVLAASTAYQVIRQPVSAWTITAGFDWESLATCLAAKNGTDTNVIILDGVAALAPLQSGILLSHATYSTALVKRPGVRMDIEYELTFTL